MAASTGKTTRTRKTSGTITPNNPAFEPGADAEQVSIYDESAPLTPFKPAPVEPAGAAETPAEAVQAADKPSEPVPLPPSVVASISDVLAQLPEDKRAEANVILSDAMQGHLTKIVDQLSADAVRDITALREQMVAGVKEVERRKIAELEEMYKPKTAEDTQKLLSQEYFRFDFLVEKMDGEDGEQIQTEKFVIRELPQAVEKQLLNLLLEKLVPMISQLQGLKFVAGSGNMEKIMTAVRTIPMLGDVIADLTVLILNPFGKKTHVTKEWVQQNISSARMAYILDAQFHAQRLRDFFSVVSRAIPR